MDTTSLWILLGGIALIYAWRAFGPGRKTPTGVLVRKIAAGATIIDVRTPAEFRGGAYPKARNLPLDSLPGKLASLGPKQTPIVVYCASGARSARAAGMLREAGFTDVSNGGGLGSMPR